MRKRPDDGVDVVCPLENEMWFRFVYSFGLQMSFISLIPFGMSLFFCVRITLTLRAARRQPINRHGEGLDTRMTSMLLTLLAIFLVCHAFVWIQSILVVVPPNSPSILIFKYYLLSCCDVFVLVNSSVNLLIYIQYMKEFRKVLCKRCCHQSELIQSTCTDVSWNNGA